MNGPKKRSRPPKGHILQLILEDISREFDEFQVNTHLCKLRCCFQPFFEGQTRSRGGEENVNRPHRHWSLMLDGPRP